ncbi:hypothetical protein B9Z55_017314 [Caenorhabditis nigoni]|nr:hypothetical protein B9Z55_017314 [Caenorhabditis nigoni]
MIGIAFFDILMLSFLVYDKIIDMRAEGLDCCNGTTSNSSMVSSTVSPISTKPYVAVQILYVIDGILRIFPSAILPILTYLLVKELKNAKLLRRKMSFTRTKEENTDSDHTTKIVVFMTISSMIAQVPLGIVYVGQGLETSQDFQNLAMDLISIFGVFSALNAALHCFICLSVSSQYRESAKKTFNCFGTIDGMKK